MRHPLRLLLKPLRLWLALIAACVVVGQRPSHAIDFPGSAHILEGVATTKDGRL